MKSLERPMSPAPGRFVTWCLAAALAMTAVPAHAFELIPSLGITRSTDAGATEGKFFGGLALRTSILQFFKLEGGIQYRQDAVPGTEIEVRQWPLTASLWVTPIPLVYAGGGLGWYRTTYDYPQTLPIKDTTTQNLAVHLGGGVTIPVAPRLGLDLNGRYIFLQPDKTNPQVPTTFNPDFWSLGLGLVISF